MFIDIGYRKFVRYNHVQTAKC